MVRPRDLWIADRNFCTTQLLYGIAGREAFFIIRQHARNLHWEFVGERQDCGRIETGQVFEQTIRTTNDGGEILFLRRVTVVLDKPTRDGDTEIHVLTNLPREDASAQVIALPMPSLAPVTIAFFPVICRSMFVSPWGYLVRSRGISLSAFPSRILATSASAKPAPRTVVIGSRSAGGNE